MKIGVIGGGAWGTALAQLAAGGGQVRLWALETDVVESINRDRLNPVYLPGVQLSSGIEASSDLGALADCDTLVVVAPTQHLRSVLSLLPDERRPLILCAKGIEEGSRKLVAEVVAEIHPNAPVAVLSGPTFAREVAMGLPTAVTLACHDLELARRLAGRLARPHFRPYASTDVIGAEIGGAVKNVMAIACGVVEGKGLGLNARAALIARGFAEMTRFGLARGGRADTLAGLSGLGDLVLTCSSAASRNFSLGKGLGEGRTAAELMADRRTVAEGAFTAPVLREAARDVGVEMPVVDAVCALLGNSSTVDEVIGALLARPLREER
jgi:glycerol-3-phosphate dehydrogenase (NAD(P)+)